MFKTLSMLLLATFGFSSLAVADSVTTWAAFDNDQQEMNVYLRTEVSGGSAIERQITHGGVNITPTLQMDGSIIWLAWVDRAKAKQYDLNYAVLLAGSLDVIEMSRVTTQDNLIYSPSITVTPQGTPWLAWAGFDGQDEEIRATYYENGHWVPERAVTDNEISDSRPRLKIQADGSLLLSWEQVTPDGVIVKHSEISPIQAYSLSLGAPSEAMIKYKKRMAQQRSFSPEQGLPASLEKRRNDVLMGNKVEIRK